MIFIFTTKKTDSLIIRFNFKSINSEVIVVNFKSLSNTESFSLVKQTTTADELDLCTIKKPYKINDNNQDFNLVSLEPYNGCKPYNKNSYTPSQINGSALYIRIGKPFDCDFKDVIGNLQKLQPKLIIVGSDGPIVS